MADLGLSADEYGDMTFQELLYRAEHKDKLWENEWKHTRMLMWLYAESHRDAKKNPVALKPEDVLRLPSDGDSEAPPTTTTDDVDRILKRYGTI